MKAAIIMKKAPIQWEKTIDKMNSESRQILCKELEDIAECATILAGYVDERHGYGCGDQGHIKAVTTSNKYGKMVHCKVFGYNAYIELKI